MDTMPGGAGQQLAGQALAFDSLLNTAKAIQELDLAAPLRLTVVTAGSQAVTGEAVPHPERALALGPCRVIPREIPNVSTRLIDLAPFDVSSESRRALHRLRSPARGRSRPGRLSRRRALDATARPGPEAGRQRAAAGARGRRLSHHRRAGRHRAGPGRFPGRQVQGAAGAGEPARPAAKGQLAAASPRAAIIRNQCGWYAGCSRWSSKARRCWPSAPTWRIAKRWHAWFRIAAPASARSTAFSTRRACSTTARSPPGRRTACAA